MRLAIFGLGKLGCPMMAAYADAGNKVVGYDPSPAVLDFLRDGKAPVDETLLQTVLDANRDNWSVTSDAAVAVQWGEIIFVIVPTPSGRDHRFVNDYVLSACETIGGALATSDDHKTVVIVSTVMPGSMRCEIIPALEKASGKRAGADFGVAYNPEFIALGSVIDDMRHPDFILIGADDERSGKIVADFHGSFHRAQHRPVPQMCVMSTVDAELAKLSVNAYLTTKIAYANQLARLCGEIPGSDASIICHAVGLDTRIGGKYLKPAVPTGGPCLPRDSKALIAAAGEYQVRMPLAEATLAVDDEWFAHMATYAAESSVVAILGAAYKPGTYVTEASAGKRLADCLRAYGKKVFVYDTPPKDLSECDIVFIVTPHPEYRDLVFNRTTVVDCWRICDPAKQPADVTIIFPNRGPA